MSFFRRTPKKPSPPEALVRSLEIPVFQTMTSRVLDRLRDPERSLDSVVEALAWDPGLVTQVLCTVNSAAYGVRAPITDVGHAVTYMGADELEHIVTVVAVKGILSTAPTATFNPTEFWRDAGTRAALARRISDELHPEYSAEAFTTGLLADIAVPLLVQNRPGAYGRILNNWNQDRTRDLAELEQAAFGWNHATVGGILARRWGLPEKLAQGITQHHGPQAMPALQLASVLQDTVAEFGLDPLMSEARDKYGLDPEWVRDCLEQSRAEAIELIQALS